MSQPTSERPRLLTPFGAWLVAAALALSFVLPVSGIGPTICPVKNIAGVSCPGCGLTRSVTAISHLELGAAWGYNPFGLVIYPLMLLGAATVVVPRRLRERLSRSLEPLRGHLATVLWVVVLTMLAFGLVRMASEVGRL